MLRLAYLRICVMCLYVCVCTRVCCVLCVASLCVYVRVMYCVLRAMRCELCVCVFVFVCEGV